MKKDAMKRFIIQRPKQQTSEKQYTE